MHSVGTDPVGSSKDASGARSLMLEEPLTWVEEYPIQWREPRFNLAELAKLRKIEREMAQNSVASK